MESKAQGRPLSSDLLAVRYGHVIALHYHRLLIRRGGGEVFHENQMK